ncbi:MAG: glutamylcysteine synthetase [Oscillospiraceae bacterium]
MFNLDLELNRKYILPIKDNKHKYIGVEFEIPIVNLNKQPVNYNIIYKMTESFSKHFNFIPLHLDDDGNPYSLQNDVTGDNLSFDFCYSNLELSMGRENNLNILNDRFIQYYNFIQEYFKPYNYTLTGMGVNPYYKINTNTPIQSSRYQMLYNYLASYKEYTNKKKFQPYANYGAFTSASQVQLDVNEENLIEVINTFNKLEPFKTVLFANSYISEYPNLLCTRDMFWYDSMHGYNPHNVGIHECELKDINDLIQYIKSSSMYCVERDNHYIFFEPIKVIDYFNLKVVSGRYSQNGTLHDITFTPQPNDIQYLRTFKFQDLTYRGTIEFRSSCCQPIYDTMTVSAFHVGLLENLKELTKLLDNDTVLYHHGYSASELRNLLNQKDIPSFIDINELSTKLIQILEVANDGLISRGLNEEKFLEPLYIRAETLINPARKLVDGLQNGYSLEDYILEYSKIQSRKEVLNYV